MTNTKRIVLGVSIIAQLEGWFVPPCGSGPFPVQVFPATRQLDFAAPKCSSVTLILLWF